MQLHSHVLLLNVHSTDIGPLTVTDNADECIDALRDLYAHGGGDCPELSMAGINAALQEL